MKRTTCTVSGWTVMSALTMVCFSSVACSTDESGGKRSVSVGAAPASLASSSAQGHRQNSNDGTESTHSGERLSSGDDHVIVQKKGSTPLNVASAKTSDANTSQLGLLACATESEYGLQENASDADSEARAQSCDKSVKRAATVKK